MRHRFLAAGIAALALTACSGAGADAPKGDTPTEVTVVTHGSFSIPDELKAKFEQDSGYTLKLHEMDDTGAMVNQLVLTKDSPLGDAVFGIDNTFSSRAESEGVIDPYVSEALDEQGKGLSTEQMSAIDFGDVCVNADKVWFEEQGLEIPTTVDDLTKPEYKDLFVAPSPATSSPGLAFLTTVVGLKGDGWLDTMQALKDNGALFVAGWTEAYNVEFTAGEGGGDRPLVLSYATSPAWTIGDDGQSTTVNLPETCFRQVEYAGVLAGAANPDGAKAFVDFMLSPEVQASIPDEMYMYPVRADVELPEEWAKWATQAEAPVEVPAAEIDEHREAWIQQWTETIG